MNSTNYPPKLINDLEASAAVGARLIRNTPNWPHIADRYRAQDLGSATELRRKLRARFR